jgi:hypothetical protein
MGGVNGGSVVDAQMSFVLLLDGIVGSPGASALL